MVHRSEMDIKWDNKISKKMFQCKIKKYKIKWYKKKTLN